MAVVLVCPLCGATASDGPEPVPGTCPGCGARYAGGGEDPRGGVRLALQDWGAGDLDHVAVADALFRLRPGEPAARSAGVTSDRRDAFYRWWVFLAADADATALLASLAERGSAST